MEQHDKNSERSRNPHWQEFLRTGSIKAYLEYKRQANPPR